MDDRRTGLLLRKRAGAGRIINPSLEGPCAIKIFDRNLCFKIKRSELRYGSKNQYYKTETIFKFQQTTAPTRGP
jgi:hypothetical protein